MHVLMLRAASFGSEHYRMWEPARAVEEAGADVRITVGRGIETFVKSPTEGAAPEVVDADAQGADVVVMQLPKTQAMLQTLRVLQAQGVAVVVEMDDLLSGVPYGHQGHDVLVRQDVARWARACAMEADFVTVSTPALLQEYAPHGRGAVVPNAIPRRIAELPPAYERAPERVTIGWTGNVFTHPYDLQEMGSGLQQALDSSRGASRFLVLGQKWDARDRLRLPVEPDEEPWIPDVDAYSARMGELFDVGIAPLRLDRFNECKSWLKPMEYSARGVFCVRARTPEYERLGLGAPAKAPKDWAKWLGVGVKDADRRRELAAAAREKVLAGHLMDHTVERWIGAWRAAADNRARARRTGPVLARS
ncbi:glycosyltransferase [Modestobacter sp. NPDC049651]|uniref:glycosyltransferase family protein n=1 Tax=unclassified Modestobacter TaxID=2643866 RepID=UPI0033D123FF